MQLTIGFSPCPNDTFIFDAMVNGKIDTGGLTFAPVLEDVETLNRWAMEGKLDVTKLSFPAFFQSLNQYVLLNSGSALGKGVGPLLISKKPIPDADKTALDEIVNHSSIAIPGVNTTANLLLSFAFPKAVNKTPMLFSEIEDAVISGKSELGVIIHENRFTYWKKGLHKALDLGEYWEEKMKVPIPLGGIAVNRSLDNEVREETDHVIRKSLEYAFANYPLITDYVKHHSQAMSEDVMRQHIDLYVNEFSLDIGKEGRGAIKSLRKCFGDVHPELVTDDSLSLFL